MKEMIMNKDNKVVIKKFGDFCQYLLDDLMGVVDDKGVVFSYVQKHTTWFYLTEDFQKNTYYYKPPKKNKTYAEFYWWKDDEAQGHIILFQIKDGKAYTIDHNVEVSERWNNGHLKLKPNSEFEVDDNA